MSHGRRFSSREYSYAYNMCIYRDGGEHCQGCQKVIGDDTTEQEQQRYGVGPKVTRLEIDHVDGNPKNWFPENLQLLCRACNLAKEEVRRGGGVWAGVWEREKVTGQARVDMREIALEKEGNLQRTEEKSSTRVVRQSIDFRQGEPTMQANAAYEPTYREWVLQRVEQRRLLGRIEAVEAGAEFVGCSLLTADRYLKKLTSSEGPLQILTNGIGEKQLAFKERLELKEKTS